MIRKLILVRVADVDAEFLERNGLKQYVVGDPLAICPKTWDNQDGLSHYGFVAEVDLKGWKAIQAWNTAPEGTPSLLQDILPKDADCSRTLAAIGLRINPEA